MKTQFFGVQDISHRAPRKALGAILSFRVDKYLFLALSIPKMPAFLTFLFWRFPERNMSFRAWSGGRLEVLGAIWEMKHCQVGNGQLSLLYNAPLIAPLMDKQWGINFADRLLHNRANIFSSSSSSLSIAKRTAGIEIFYTCIVQNC